MDPSVTISLLRPGVTSSPNQLWFDLGAGTGVFTLALADLLNRSGSEGRIIAIDRDAKALRDIPDSVGKITITKHNGDFTTYSFDGVRADGILLANSLHFVKDKLPLMVRFREALKPAGVLLIVEYEMIKSNPWVPYPINFDGLEKLGTQAGFSSITKLATADSSYQAGGIYSAAIR